MNIKELLQARLDALNGVLSLNQAGKKLSASTIATLKSVMDTLEKLMGMDDADEMGMAQAWLPIQTALLRADVTGTSTSDTFESVIALQDAIVQAFTPKASEKKPLTQADVVGHVIEQGAGKLPFLLQQMPAEFTDVTESTDGKSVTFGGTATVADVKNSHGQVYPLSLWQAQIPMLVEMASAGRLTGVAPHPTGPDGKPIMIPSPLELSHKFTNVFMQGNEMKYEAFTLDTEAGRNLAGLLKGGVGLDTSTRAVGELMQGQWNGETVDMPDPETFRLFGIDVVLNGASPGSAIEYARLQDASAEPENKEKTAMDEKQIRELMQAAIAEGNKDQAALLQSVLDKMSTLEQSAMTPEDRALLQSVKDTMTLKSRDTKIGEAVDAMIQSKELPSQFKASAVSILQGMCATAEDVDGKLQQAKDALAPVLVQHKEMVSKGFIMNPHNDDGTQKNNIENLQQGVDELIQSAEVRGLVKKSDKASYPWEVNGKMRDFGDMSQNLRILAQSMLQEHPEAGVAYFKLRNGELKNLNQAKDLMTSAGIQSLMQAGSSGVVTGDIAAAIPYMLPMVMEIYPQLLAATLLGTLEPLTKSTGSIYHMTETYESGSALSDASAFSGTYANSAGEGQQVKYVDMEITEESVTCEIKKLGWKQTMEVLRHLSSDFGIDGSSVLVRGCAGQIAREWNFEHLSNMLTGATAGNVDYGTAIPTDLSFDGKQWQEQFTGHVLKARGLVWKKRYCDTTYIVGDSDSIDLLVRLNKEVGITNNGQGTIARGVNIVGSLSTGETLVKIAWWDQLVGKQNKLLIAGRGNIWPETGYVIAPYQGLYVTPAWVDPDTLQQKQSMMSEVANKMVDGNYFATVTIQPGVAGTPL